MPIQRYIATSPILTPAHQCICGMQHREPMPALCCLRRFREQRLTVQCFIRDRPTSWPMGIYPRVQSYCSSLGLSLVECAPTLYEQHSAAAAQQSLPLEPAPVRQGQAWLTRASSYR